MKYKVIISDRARESLALHLRFLTQVSRPAAVKLKEKMLKLRENLLAVEEDRAMGRRGSTIDELESFLDGILDEG